MELIGHELRWQALARAYARGKLPNTLLISGPPHVGKTTLLTRYAQLLLCAEVTEDREGFPAPCGQCRTCRQVASGAAMDFRVFRPLVASADEKDWVYAPEGLDSSIITIGVARRFAEQAGLKPFGGARKVLVLTQIDRMNDEAQNALLKTFEEPAPSTFLVFTTDNAARLKPTVLSRCWHLPLVPVASRRIETWLRAGFPGADHEHLAAAVLAAHGCPGVAWNALSQVAGPEAGGAAEEHLPRFKVTAGMLAKLDSVGPVGALALTEEAIKWGRAWWEEDAGEAGDLKKHAAKVNRAQIAHFLDELALAARIRWVESLDHPQTAASWAARLDLMRKTRQYILRNANPNLALDVMFGRLIALRVGGARRTASR